jgi:hypothetical protein
MTLRTVLVLAVLSLLVLPVVPTASAAAAEPAALTSVTPLSAAGATSHPVLARFGVGRSYGSRSGYGSRARNPYGRSTGSYRRASRPYRPRIGHFFGNVLKALGIAYLFHMLFGWGAGGGSPLGLLLVLAFVAWLVLRRRRRDMRWDRGY